MKRASTPETTAASASPRTFFFKAGMVEKLIAPGQFAKKFFILSGDRCYVHKKPREVTQPAKGAEQTIPLVGLADLSVAINKKGGRSFFMLAGQLFAIASVEEFGPWVEMLTRALENANRNSDELMMRAMALVVASPALSSSRDDLRTVAKVCRSFRALAATQGRWSPVSSIRLPCRVAPGGLVARGLPVPQASEALLTTEFGSTVAEPAEAGTLERALRPMLALRPAFVATRTASLGNHAVTDTALPMVMQLFPRLETMHIDGSSVTDAGIDELATAARNGAGSCLRFISLYHCSRVNAQHALEALSKLPQLATVLIVSCDDSATSKLPRSAGQFSLCRTCGCYFRESLNADDACLFHPSPKPSHGAFSCCKSGVPPSVGSPGCKLAKHVAAPAEGVLDSLPLPAVYDCPAEALRWRYPGGEPRELQLENLWLRRSVLVKGAHPPATTCRCLRKRSELKP